MLAREVARRGHWHCCQWMEHECDESFRFGPEHAVPNDPVLDAWVVEYAHSAVVVEQAAIIYSMALVNPL